MNDVAVVVLHYETVNDTEECVDSLLLQSVGDFNIIIVDNGSKIRNTDRLKKKYQNRKKIHFIDSKENLGFAKGNNLGFIYAKNELKARIIILANNDLVFNDVDFIKSMLRIYESEKFDVAGPKIISLSDGMNQNPVKRLFVDLKSVKKRLLKLYILYVISYMGLDNLLNHKVSKSIEEYHYIEDGDFQLHGACMIFGNRFVKEHNGLYPGTFMYGEEDILKYQIESEKLKLVYLDDITVNHKEGSSTIAIFGESPKKRRFFYRWSINSIRQLEKLMQMKN